VTPALLWCATPSSAVWQLGSLPAWTGHVDLLGWIEARRRVDAGVPPDVASVLARALTDVARVAVVTDAPLVLRWAGPPSIVEAAFDDAHLPWWLQGQIFVLAALDEEPPELDPAQVLTWRDDAWTRLAAAHTRVRGLVRPGVDGDVAGIWTRDAKLREKLLAALDHRAQEAGRRWLDLDESAFAEHLRED
jgi:hypothetical protein